MARPGVCISPVVFLVVFTIIQISALKYETGTKYKYSYRTSVLFNDVDGKTGSKSQRGTGVHLSLDVDITPLLQEQGTQLFKLKLNTATVLSASREKQEKPLGSLLKYPVYFELNDNQVGRLFIPESDSAFCTNIKKGIISLFQVQEKQGEESEIDVSGECTVQYTQTSSTQITKTKTNCKTLEIAGQYSTANKILGVSTASKTTLTYEFDNGIIKHVGGIQKVSSHLNMRASLNGGVSVSQKFTFLESSSSEETVSASDVDGAIPQLETKTGMSLTMSLLPTDTEVTQCVDNCESPIKLLSKLHKELEGEKLSTVGSAKAFLKMLKSLRNAGRQTIAEVLTSQDAYNIVPQLIDIATAAQTTASQKAMMDLLVFNEDYGSEHPERYLLAAAFSSHPGEYLIKDLLNILRKPVPNESLKESLHLASGAIVHTFCQRKEQCKNEVVKEFEALLVDGLEKCENDGCRLMFLRALGNTGLPATIPVIMKQLHSSTNSMVCSTAVDALRRMPKESLDQKVKSSLTHIFHQTFRQYDSTVRTAALDLLLQLPVSVVDVEYILLASGDPKQHELSTFVQSKLFDRANSDENLRNMLKTVLQKRRVNNYNLRAQGGKSSSFTGFFAKTTDINCTYNLMSETTNRGVMRQSGMKVDLLGDVTQPFMNIAIYGEGLESMMSDDEETGEKEKEQDEGEEKEDEPGPEIAAGLSFYLMDVLLKQYEFFRGMSGLMSAVWNAPSELTTALQGNLLLQDHFEHVHLSNGLILNIEVTGVLSIDLSGYVSISLWNRNCESLIKNSGALYVEGTLQLESNELASGITFSGEGENAIDFLSDVDFYDMPLKMCLQMKRPPCQFIERLSKFEHIKGLKKYHLGYRKTKSVSGESYFLNKGNSKECRIMKKDNE